MSNREVSGADLLRFALMPQLGHNLRAVADVFGVFVWMFAQIFLSAGLIDRTHPALQTQRLSLDDFARLIVDASARLRFSWRGLPQLVIFYAVVGFVACTVIAGALGLFQLLVGTAMAQSLFEAEGDRAGRWIQQVFAINGTVAGMDPLAVSLGPMLSVYSQGTLVLGGILISWTLINVVSETAHHGVVLGKSHNELWAPIRLVFALGMLVPLGAGFNAGQMMIVQFASWGSGLATNVWGAFVDDLTSQTPMVGRAMVPDVAAVVKGLYQLEHCKEAANLTAIMAGQRRPNIARGLQQVTGFMGESGNADDVNALVIRYDRPDVINAMNQERGVLGFDNPFAVSECGQIKISAPSQSDSGGISQAQGEILQAHRDAVLTVIPEIEKLAKRSALRVMPRPEQFRNVPGYSENFMAPVTAAELRGVIDLYANELNGRIGGALGDAVGDARERARTRVTALGWAGAATWFFEMAQWNSSVLNAAAALPEIQTREQNYAGATGLFDSARESWNDWWGGTAPTERDFMNRGMRLAEADFDRIILNSGVLPASVQADAIQPDDENYFMRKLSALLPLNMVMKHFMESDSPPLIKLIEFGEGLRTVSGYALAGAAVVAWQVSETVGLLIAGAALTVFTAAATLYILIPLMPAIRFVFGILSWMLSIFEAVVAVPILALAHLRTDGSGLMGPMAQTGYLLLLQIFVRPTLMIFGLVGGLMIFNVTVLAFNETFALAIQTIHNGSSHGVLTSIVYVVIYVMVMYTLSNMSFKAIDMVPDRVLSWIGSSGMAHMSGGTDAASRATSVTSGKESEVIQSGIGAAGKIGRGGGR